MNKRSPRVKAKPMSPRLSDIGTLNPVALDCSMFQQRSLFPSFDEVSELSTKASDLKSEIARLKGELESLLTSEHQTKFTRFKKAELDFERKLEERDLELDNFAKFLNVYRVDSNPTFVEVEALQSTRNRPIFDAINASLLVSNPQRNFFRRNDIEFQNEELKSIIGEQEQVLRLLEARLKLFSSYQSATTAQFTVDSLRRGMTPTVLGGRTPTKLDEISTKHRALSNELAVLVRERKSLTQKRVAAKLVRRRRRERARMTLSGQHSVRFGTPASQQREGSPVREPDAPDVAGTVAGDGGATGETGERDVVEGERAIGKSGATESVEQERDKHETSGAENAAEPLSKGEDAEVSDKVDDRASAEGEVVETVDAKQEDQGAPAEGFDAAAKEPEETSQSAELPQGTEGVPEASEELLQNEEAPQASDEPASSEITSRTTEEAPDDTTQGGQDEQTTEAEAPHEVSQATEEPPQGTDSVPEAIAENLQDRGAADQLSEPSEPASEEAPQNVSPETNHTEEAHDFTEGPADSSSHEQTIPHDARPESDA